MCWRVSTPVPKAPKGVATDHYKAESAAVIMVATAVGAILGGPLGAVTGMGAGAGLHHTLWQNERINHATKVDSVVGEATVNATRAKETRDNAITVSVTAGLFIGIKKAIWG